MEPWELDAREQIRDLVARYNANGDRGRFEAVLELFAPDATMDVDDGRVYDGVDEIVEIFTGTRESVVDESGPAYIQHHHCTHLIDVHDAGSASGQLYFHVFTDAGIDHWGRYQDSYRVVDGRWRFASRRVRTDGCTPGGWAERRIGAGTDS